MQNKYGFFFYIILNPSSTETYRNHSNWLGYVVFYFIYPIDSILWIFNFIYSYRIDSGTRKRKVTMSEENAPVEQKEADDNKPAMLNMSVDDFNKAVINARQEGANMLYSELISYQMSCLEVFANQFKPANASFEQFLGFVLYTLQQEYNAKYQKKQEVKDEKDDGKPEAVQGKDGESQEAPKGGHEDVQQGESGGQGTNQEPQDEKKEVEGE